MKQENTTSGSSALFLLSLLGGALYYFFVRPQMLKWGSRLGESQRRLPGDEIIPDPSGQTTCAIDIDAPAEAVWPWLAQMGRERTGWYGLDILLNNGIPSATYLRRDLGEPVPGLELDRGLRVMTVEKKRLLVLGGFDLPNPVGGSMDVTLAYLLERKSDGGTRLLVRTRKRQYGFGGRIYELLREPLDFVLSYQQLNSLKARAETMAHLQIPIPLEHEISLN